MEAVKKNGRPLNPRASANPLSALTFAWILPIFWKGLKTEMQENHLTEPLEEHASGPLGDKFARLWEEEVTKAGSKRTPSLLRVILRAYAARTMLYGFVLLVMECGIRLAQPLLLGMLVEYYSPDQNAISRQDAYWYAGSVVLCSALNIFFVHPSMMAILHMGMKFRVACCSLIYRKSLRLSKTALGETTVGQVVNLLSNDVNRFDVAVIFVHYIWLGPLATLLTTYLMWQEIQWAAVVGVGVMLCFIPFQGYLGKRTSVLRLKTALRTDERVRLMNEILSGIQVIKMYTWEKPFADLVAKARKKEIREIRAMSYIRGVMTSFIMFTTRICLFISILVYVLDKNIISAKQVFVVTSLYSAMRQPMTVFFPQGIAQVAEALISVKRLQNFLLYEDTSKPVPGLAEIISARKKESKSDSKKHKKDSKESKTEPKESEFSPKEIKEEKLKSYEEETHSEKPVEASKNGTTKPAPLERGEEEEEDLKAQVDDDRCSLRLRNATAKWIATHTENTLTDLSFAVKPGNLIAVIGPVGAGKSSLLEVILKELPLISGSIYVGGTVSYASQEPWLFAGSVRQNILFGQEMDRPRYNAVVRRCALDRDFSLLPNGDKTVVGERGVSLSGGQRARISLARAVYKRADIYLMDDPLSAVDAHVGRHLFESCVVGYLRHTTRVLVTHQLHLLKEVDQIIILKNGSIAAAGTFETLSASGMDLETLLEREEMEEEKVEPTPSIQEEIILHESFRKRQMSFHSVSSIDNLTAIVPPEGGREEAEMRSTGAVSSGIYGAYFRACGHPIVVMFMMLIAILSQLLGSSSDWWTSFWVNNEEAVMFEELKAMGPLQQAANLTTPMVANVDFNNGLTRYDCIYIYTGMIVALVVISLARSFMFFSLAMMASTRLHNRMFESITRAPMRFFHVNPSGRILNRFSKDMGAVDEVLPTAMLDVLQIFLSLAGIITVVAVVNYWLLIPTVAIGFIFYFIRIFYITSSRSIKRLEGVTRSPVFSHLNATLRGMTTIRAFGAQEALIREFDNHQDLHSSAWYLFIASSRAFGFWLDLVCLIYIAVVTFSFLILEKNLQSAGNVGLAITQAMTLTGMFQWGMRQSTELENQMTSVERIEEYTKIESEPPLQSEAGKRPPLTWPENGTIEFKNMSLYYAPGEPAVLKDLTLVINAREKVGIVGRTGAGKSSLINALFRLATIDGEIIIDGRETGSLGLHELRSRISIIPQEPVLFSGTMRHNLDPFDEYPDVVLWTALDEVEMKEAVSELPAGLNSRMAEGGTNFSVGQRQLVCLARAIVRKSRLLVLDEATANVDPQTDALIQKTIRVKFAECTVLTIAHRLHTVMDSDKVLVMDAGRMVEFDHPHILLQREDSVLRGMVEQTGKAMAETLMKIAMQEFERKTKSGPSSSDQ